MYKDDFIMRIITHAATVINAMMSKLKDGKPAEAQEILDAAYEEFVGISRHDAASMSAEQLNLRLSHGEMGGAGRLIMLTELLQAEALINDSEERGDRAFHQRLKALDLRLELAVGHQLQNAHLDGMVDQLLGHLDAFHLPYATSYALFRYYERTGQFDLAENVLFDLIDTDQMEYDMIEEGLSFFERLMRKSDGELLAGNLPRDEVEDGFEELWEMQAGHLP